METLENILFYLCCALALTATVLNLRWFFIDMDDVCSDIGEIKREQTQIDIKLTDHEHRMQKLERKKSQEHEKND